MTMNRKPELEDALTGAFSRAFMQIRLEEELERARRYGLSFALLVLDLDHFKSVNDSCGHAQGDQVLREFVARLKTMTRDSDLVFRYGGDEFVILLPHTCYEQACALAQRLAEGVRATPFSGPTPLSLTLSIGLATFPSDGQTFAELFECADQRHYCAKRTARGRVVSEDIASPDTPNGDDDNRLIERDQATAAFQEFLSGLADGKRGLFIISGASGVGKSRFLDQVSGAARMQGFGVLSLRGSAALRTRVYGALQAQKTWPHLPPLGREAGAFAHALADQLAERQHAGLFIAVDNIAELDSATLRLLRALLFSSDVPVTAIACTVNAESMLRVLPWDAPLKQVVTLEPLSQIGIRVWLRGQLHWEAPQAFVEWLERETGGFPAYLQQGLSYLIEKRIIAKENGGWIIQPNFVEIALKERAKPAFNNLPLPQTSFIGREDEIQQVKELIEEGRLLTVMGPGGIGKTRLAIQAAGEMASQFSHGVCFVSLVAVNTPDALVPATVNALGLTSQGTADLQAQLVNYLREKEMLLILDNLEHLVEGAEMISTLLRACPRVKIVATSRERLNLQEEWVLTLQGLEIPEEISLANLETCSGAQLFIERARQARADFALSVEDRPFVQRIIQLVGGLPLGIELAAAWVRSLTCAEIAQEIERNVDWLTTSLRNVPERHRSLRAVFEHSWNLLNAEEQRAFRQLAVFRGGFRREAVEQVAGASLQMLADLSDKSLLNRRPNGRYVRHPLVWQYAEEKLAQAPDEQFQTLERHCAYYAEFLHQKLPRLGGSDQKEALAEIDAEIENVRAAWRWALANERTPQIAACLESIALYYDHRGCYREGDETFGQAIAVLERDHAATIALAKALARQGTCRFNLGRYDQARESLQKSVSVLQATDAHVEIAFALGALGSVDYREGNYAAANDFAHRSLKEAQQSGQPREVARALSFCGTVASALGEYAVSKSYYADSLAILRQIGDRWLMAIALNNLGYVTRVLGELAEAKQVLEESLGITRASDFRRLMAYALSNLGGVANSLGEYAQAEKHFQASLAMAREIGDRNLIVYTLGSLGDVAGTLGDYGSAWNYLNQSLRVAVEMEAVPRILANIVRRAILIAQQGGEAQERAVELLAHPLGHPATEKTDHARGEQLRAELEAALPPAIFRRAWRRGQARSLAEVAEEILKNA